MRKSRVPRETVLKALREALVPLDYVHAMWEAGAAAFNRVDQWSDIDLYVDADDAQVTTVPAVIERTLHALSPIEIKYEIPQPAWHGHWQAFYRLRDASEFLLLDIVVMKHSNPNKFLESEIHGKPLIHFDKSNVVRSEPLDRRAFLEKLEGRMKTLQDTFELFQALTLKELHRQNDIEALVFYYGFTLRPLVEALRIKYAPMRYNFHSRYLYYDLPREVVEGLEELFFVANRNELHVKREKAEQLFYKTLDEINLREVAKLLEV